MGYIMSFQDILTEFSKDDLIYYFLPIYFLALILEWRHNRSKNLNLFDVGDTKASLWMMFFVGFVDIAPKLLAFMAFYYLAQFSPLAEVVQRQWWAWGLLFFLDDFIYYWFHRLNHQVRLFWAGHVSHHSAIKMNFATALRQGVGERVHKYVFWLPLPLLGFDPLMIFTMMSINLFYQYWLHTELIGRLPDWIEFVFNTPSHHRVHHASNISYLDCNHGGVLIIWDRLFGSFSREMSNEKVEYGLTQNIISLNPIYVATHEYRSLVRDVARADHWKDKLKYLVLAPGWSHDGGDKRSKTLRASLQG
ncbi:MAG: sterol desaturase/sphingolipid hydroxylase (fatty acid hydroxylase superfamily) [Arenicella sp.]|jgi:sterol desaturase/sphingolipid hydroxylase (fatty acid hydroxylase superfamily)